MEYIINNRLSKPKEPSLWYKVVGLASVGCVGNVILGQFLYGSENRVGTACAKCRMKREVVHQMSGDILYA